MNKRSVFISNIGDTHFGAGYPGLSQSLSVVYTFSSFFPLPPASAVTGYTIGL